LLNLSSKEQPEKCEYKLPEGQDLCHLLFDNRAIELPLPDYQAHPRPPAKLSDRAQSADRFDSGNKMQRELMTSAISQAPV
jgi:hypothetical protein